MSHGSDLVHLWTDEAYPESVVANGGVFVWKDGRENPDTCVAAVTYPKGFLYTYKTTFGNSYRSFSRIQGRDGTIANHGGEGASFFAVSKEGGRDESDGSVDYTKLPIIAPAGDHEKVVQVPGAPPPSSNGPDDDDAHHLMNWLTAMQARKAAECYGGQWFLPRHCRDHGGAIVSDREEALLGSEEREEFSTIQSSSR